MKDFLSWLRNNNAAVKALMEGLPEPFHCLLKEENASLLCFLAGEKALFPEINSLSVITTHPESKKKTECGYTVDLQIPNDRSFVPYRPEALSAFKLKGIWLPIRQGNFYETDTDLNQDTPLIRINKDVKEILFLIHPRSETYYQTLLAQHTYIEIYALSLSSYRSLIVAVPGSEGFEIAMVKISLNETINQTNRLLSERECALSIANSILLKKRLSEKTNILEEVDVLEDIAAFAPQNFKSGMLIRSIPTYLKATSNNVTLLPFLSILGEKNRNFFCHLVKKSSLSLTDFLLQKIIRPLANLFITSLFQANASLECHAQNLLFKLNNQGEFIGLAFRDMGGVNLLPSETDLNSLPEPLRDPDIYYSSTHLLDAANSLESHIVRRFLLQLTLQIARCDSVFNSETDENYQTWRNEFLINSKLKPNWQVQLSESEVPKDLPTSHKSITFLEQVLHFFTQFLKKIWEIFQKQKQNNQKIDNIIVSEKHFVRYGFCETLFFHMICERFETTCNIEVNALKKKFCQKMCLEGRGFDAQPNTYIDFFYALIQENYAPPKVGTQLNMCHADPTEELSQNSPNPFFAKSATDQPQQSVYTYLSSN